MRKHIFRLKVEKSGIGIEWVDSVLSMSHFLNILPTDSFIHDFKDLEISSYKSYSILDKNKIDYLLIIDDDLYESILEERILNEWPVMPGLKGLLMQHIREEKLKLLI